MFGSNVLEVAIALAFLYFILSLVVTSVREGIEAVLQTRSVHLERGIRELLNDENGKLAQRLYNHPLIASLFQGTYDRKTLTKTFANRVPFIRNKPWDRMPLRSMLPAYIPARTFALAVMDFAARPDIAPSASTAPMTVDTIRAGLPHIRSARLRRSLVIALDGAGDDIKRVQAALEEWFDSGMDRVSGLYKKETHFILFSIAAVVAVVLNVDTPKVATALHRADAARAVIIAEAEATVQQAALDPAPKGMDYQRALGCPPTAATAQTQPAAATTASATANETAATPTRPTAIGRAAGTTTAQTLEQPTVTATNTTMASETGETQAKQAPKEGAEKPSFKSCAQQRLEELDYAIGWTNAEPQKWTVLAWCTSIFGWLVTAFALTLGAPFWFDLLNKMMVIRSTVKPHEKSPEEGSEDRRDRRKLLGAST